MPVSGKYHLTFWDFDSERASVGCFTEVVNDTNYPTIDAALDDLRVAIEAVSLGVVKSEGRYYEYTTSIITPPSDENAQREDKWLVSGHDDTQELPWKMEIPCADDSLLSAVNRKSMDPESAEYAALVAAIEAVAVNNNGNAIVVDSITRVGRNL